MLRGLCLFLACLPALAQEGITALERRELPLQRIAPASHSFVLTLAYLDSSGWRPEAIHAAANEAARIFGQCDVAVEKTELVRFAAPARYRDFQSSVSRELARALNLGKPTIYFVVGSRQRPAFEAEAIGRGNSRSRPELADTVWVTLGTRDPGIALAHELAHVLMDSGEHSEAPGNLMREDTSAENTSLTDAQCARIKATGLANGLLR
jgi:hypothetical protein